MTGTLPARAIWALGITQIVGYGTLYYAFSVLAPHIGDSFGWSPEAVFGALTIALLAGGVLSPVAGHLIDRIGATRAMTIGSGVSALCLTLAGLAPNGFLFAAALIAMEVASTLVLYAAAFAAIVQMTGSDAQRRITHLTLIAGFASTVFWPLTSLLLSWMDWRSVYFVFGAINLMVCVPLHWWLGRFHIAPEAKAASVQATAAPVGSGSLNPGQRKIGFALMLAGFAIEGLVLSAILLQVVPILSGLSLGASAIIVTTIFGPAQVLSRFVNLMFGKELLPTRLAIVTACLMPVGATVLVLTAPSLLGGMLFALLFGLGSGLTSIISGSLPLQLMGRERYGSRLGWLSSARQVASALAPFLMAIAMGAFGITSALWIVVASGSIGVLIFMALAWLSHLPGASGARVQASEA
jgi:MFS family permease